MPLIDCIGGSCANSMCIHSPTEGTKFDSEKLQMDLISPEALEELAKVLTQGAKKYNRKNWEKGIDYSRIIGAVYRHINKWRLGEDIDPESGFNHISHAMCNLMFLITYISRDMKQFDDRKGDK